jgi:hypothetical protein
MEKKELLNGILENIRAGKNTLIWKNNTLPFVVQVQDKYKYTVYINETAPIKPKITEIIIKLSQLKGRKNIETESELLKLTAIQLKEILKKRVQKDKLVIIFNHFENITKSVAQFWLSISGNKHIVFVGSVWGTWKKEAYGFYKVFNLINKEEREESRAEMNITIPVIIILGGFIFAVLFKLSIISSDKAMTSIIMSILITRSILYFVK